MGIYPLHIKRLLDVLVSSIILFLTSPIIVFLTIILALEFKGTPFFFQLRPGRNEKLFRVIKFRTMNNSTDAMGKLLSDGERLTAVGRMVRKLSLDEIPQLINVFKGDMSLIGPRPLLIRYLPYYKDSERRRHDIRPGITGLAQVNGRNLLNWDTRLEMDVYYVNNLSFKLDILIMSKTIMNTILAKDIVVDANTKMIDLDKLRESI